MQQFPDRSNSARRLTKESCNYWWAKITKSDSFFFHPTDDQQHSQ